MTILTTITHHPAAGPFLHYHEHDALCRRASARACAVLNSPKKHIACVINRKSNWTQHKKNIIFQRDARNSPPIICSLNLKTHTHPKKIWKSQNFLAWIDDKFFLLCVVFPVNFNGVFVPVKLTGRKLNLFLMVKSVLLFVDVYQLKDRNKSLAFNTLFRGKHTATGIYPNNLPENCVCGHTKTTSSHTVWFGARIDVIRAFRVYTFKLRSRAGSVLVTHKKKLYYVVRSDCNLLSKKAH